jgi:hypothetical protein
VRSGAGVCHGGRYRESRVLGPRLKETLPIRHPDAVALAACDQAQLALDKKNPAPALNALQASSPIELGIISFVNNISCLYHVDLRGEAYLAAGQGGAAAAEFQKILDHSGIVWNCWTGALAHLGVARANALQARNSRGVDADAARFRALAACKDLLTLWKDADRDIPVLAVAHNSDVPAIVFKHLHESTCLLRTTPTPVRTCPGPYILI